MRGKEKSGISLIVLVITIIVIIILATAVIVSIAKNNPIEEANTARYTSDVASMQSVLTMTVSKIAAEKKCNVKVKEGYVNSVKTGVKETEGTVNIEFENAVDGAKTATVKFGKGKNENNTYYTGKLLPVYPSGETSWYVDKNGNIGLNLNGTKYNEDKVNFPIEHKGIIPKGATYYKGVTGNDFSTGNPKYTEGQPFPEIAQGDVYVYGDYEYRYMQESDRWGWKNITSEGWGVKPLSYRKKTYGEILENINNKNIVSLRYTFYQFSTLTQAPVIPSTVTNMDLTFYQCSALTQAPVIPEGVISMAATFEECSALKEAPVIPSTVTYMGGAFYGCSALKEAPVIPEGVTSMGETFRFCSSLEIAPVIPSTVTDMTLTFNACRALKGTVTINANPTSLYQCFYDCSDLTLTGTCPVDTLNKIAATGTNIKVAVP